MKFHLQQVVEFRPSTQCFFNNETRKRVKGITSLLKDVFYSNYNFFRATQGVKSEVTASKIKGPQGILRGKIVDEQVAETIAGKPPKKPHVFTNFVFAALRKANFTPRLSQVVVYDQNCNLATAIDILCTDGENKPVLIELKCSSDSRYNQYSGPMKGAMAHVNNSLANQHILQAQVTRILWQKTYGVPTRSFILQINAGGANFIAVPEDERINLAYQELVREAAPAPAAAKPPRQKKPRRPKGVPVKKGRVAKPKAPRKKKTAVAK